MRGERREGREGGRQEGCERYRQWLGKKEGSRCKGHDEGSADAAETDKQATFG